MGLPPIMVKKDPGRAMQLTDNDPFGAINDKGPSFCHHGNGPKIDFLLLNVPDAFCPISPIRIKDK